MERLFIIVFTMFLLLSCKKDNQIIDGDSLPNLADSEILCLNAGNAEHEGLVQLYLTRKNTVSDLLFTTDLGIKKLFKFNSEIYALTQNSVLKFNNERSAIDFLYNISYFDKVKLNGKNLFLYSKISGKIKIIDITNGALIGSININIDLVDYALGNDDLYLLSVDSLFDVSLNTYEQVNSTLLFGECKDLELVNDLNAFVVSKTDSVEVLLSIDLNSFGIVGLSSLSRGHIVKSISIEKGKDFITYITNYAHFYHGKASDLGSVFRFINKPFDVITSFVYTDGLDFVMVENRYGLEQGRIYQYSFYGPKLSETKVGYNPIQLLLLD